MSSLSELKVIITEYVNNQQPGWVRCCFLDIDNNVHFITEKVPVVTMLDLNENSELPQSGNIRCRVIGLQDDGIITIDINSPDSIEDENGQTIFKVSKEQLE